MVTVGLSPRIRTIVETTSGRAPEIYTIEFIFFNSSSVVLNFMRGASLQFEKEMLIEFSVIDP